MGEWRYSCTHS